LKNLERDKKIVPIYLSNGLSSTLVIPIQLARRYQIDKPSYVTVEGTKDGILVKKMEFGE
jgi:hypothetical protein